MKSFRLFLLGVIITACLNFLTAFTHAEDTITIPHPLPACPVSHIRDGLLSRNGNIWVVGENSSLHRLIIQPGMYDWENLGYSEGCPQIDNFTCIAQDKQDRIWIGTHNSGVVVFNGASWKIYDRNDSLPGEHIYDIAVSPVSGEVAIATSGGIAIYNPADETWRELIPLLAN